MKLAFLFVFLAFSTLNLTEDKTLFKLEQGEYIVNNESQLKAAFAGDSYSIVTKQSGKFYVHTTKGKAGPFDKLPPEYLPVGGLRTSNTHLFEDPGSSDGKTEMGMAADGSMTIKLDDKVIATLPPGEVPGGLAVDKQKNRMAYVTMTADDNGNLTYTITEKPSGKKLQIKGAMIVQIKKNSKSGNFLYEAMTQDGQKTFYTESGEKTGPFSNGAKVFELYDNKSIVVMDPAKDQQGTNIIKDGKTIHTIKNSNSDAQLLFSADASKYLAVSSRGLEFSDGTSISNGILPTIEKTAKGSNLLYLRVNENKEVIQSSQAW